MASAITLQGATLCSVLVQGRAEEELAMVVALGAPEAEATTAALVQLRPRAATVQLSPAAFCLSLLHRGPSDEAHPCTSPQSCLRGLTCLQMSAL